MDKRKLWIRTSLGLAGVAMAIGVGVSLGGTTEPMETKGADAPVYSIVPVAGKNNSYSGNCDIVIDGITWNLEGNSQLLPWRVGGKSITNTDRAVYSKTAMPHAIEKVNLQLGTIDGIDLNSLKLEVASDAGFNTKIDTVTAASYPANSPVTFLPTAGTSWAKDSYYKFVFNVTVSGSKNKFVEFVGADFYEGAPAKVPSILTYEGALTKTEYLEGEAFDPTGLTFSVVYDDEAMTTVDVTDKVVYTPEYLSAGDTSVTASYTEGGVTLTETIGGFTVTARELTGIAVTTQPTKTSYFVGDTLDTKGLVVTGTFNVGDPADVTDDCTFSPQTLTTAGEQTITVTHKDGLATSFKVNVQEVKATGLSLTGKKTSFNSGENFELGADAKLTLKYNNGTTKDLTLESEGVVVRRYENQADEPEAGEVITLPYVLDYERDNGKYFGIEYEGVSVNKYEIAVKKVFDYHVGTFEKVTATDQIGIGDTIVFSSADGLHAMSATQDNNNRHAVSTSLNGGHLVVDQSVQFIELEEGNKKDTYAFYVGDGYLYAAGSGKGSNYLRTEDNKSDNSSWKISVAGNGDATILAQGTNTNNSLRFNNSSQTNLLFSCYASGQQPIHLYKFVADADKAAVQSFVDSNMHFADYNENQNLCLGDNGYYKIAKDAIQGLTEVQLRLFKTHRDFEAARARYEAWAIAYQDATPYNAEITSMSNANGLLSNASNRNFVYAMTGIVSVALAAFAGFFFYRKRKTNQ